MNDMLKNPFDNHYLYSFDSLFKYHGLINVLVEEQFVQLPKLCPNGCTNTVKPLLDICSKINQFKPNIKVVLYTDGQTDSTRRELENVANVFKRDDVKFEIVAITNTNTNMENIRQNEEVNIPGMDLINMLGNAINSLKIYNKVHVDVPYVGVSNSNISKNNVEFMNVGVKMPIIHFINCLLNKLEEHGNNISWGVNDFDLKKMLTEIGKLWSLMTIEFDDEHPFINRLSEKINELLGIEYPINRIINIIKYGFNCAKTDKPIVMTNFEDKVKQNIVKHQEFKDATAALNMYGTALGSSKLISMPNSKGICAIVRDKSLNIIKNGSNICYDMYGNAYFGIDANEQAIRIGMRMYANDLGFTNARGSPNVIFLVLNQMSLMYIKGEDFYSEHMKELRKIAIAQTSMEGMVSNKTYDGVGFYTKWKNGQIPKIHYSNPQTHTSLFTDNMINPLRLPETIWWAFMMAMLDIFDEQLFGYKSAIESLGIESSKDSFLQYIKNQYKDNIDGCVKTLKIGFDSKSIFTLDDFGENDTIYLFKNHLTDNGHTCNANTWYSQQEIDNYVKINGCVWCRHIPTIDELEIIEKNSLNINSVINEASKLRTINLTFSNSKTEELSVGINNLKINNNTLNPSNKYRIVLFGITGAGKSTTALSMKTIIENNGGRVLIINTDNHAKMGIKGKQMNQVIYKEITDFEKKLSNNANVIIVDLCNEKGPNNIMFNFDFYKNNYTDFHFYPQFDKNRIDEYEAWCLKNVITRPMHTNQTLYWLNPSSAGLNICIKVHNTKTQHFRNYVNCPASTLNINESDNMETVLGKINAKADDYTIYLSSIDTLAEITAFLTNHNLVK